MGKLNSLQDLLFICQYFVLHILLLLATHLRILRISLLKDLIAQFIDRSYLRILFFLLLLDILNLLPHLLHARPLFDRLDLTCDAFVRRFLRRIEYKLCRTVTFVLSIRAHLHLISFALLIRAIDASTLILSNLHGLLEDAFEAIQIKLARNQVVLLHHHVLWRQVSTLGPRFLEDCTFISDLV